ncbi:MAG: SEC-C metal-binding domain-containing protein [Bryobacteraceae bacterium]
MTEMKLGRNAPCRCGSGRKYKNCHLAADEAAEIESDTPPTPHPREYWEILKSILPPQVRSDEVGPPRRR